MAMLVSRDDRNSQRVTHGPTHHRVMDLGTAVDDWNDNGFVVLPAFFDHDELAPAIAELPTLYPTADEFHDNVDPPRNERFRDEFAGIDDFPFRSPEISLLAVHPKLTTLAERLLCTSDIRVFSIEAWAKYTGAANYDQHLHRDYLAHTLLVPSPDIRFGQVEMFLYLSDVPAELGAPAYVATQHTTDLPVLPNWYPRNDRATNDAPAGWAASEGRPDLFDREVRATGPAGTVVAYTNRTFHRGTELTAPRGARYTIHVNFRPAASEWQARHSWLSQANEDAWHDFVRRASPRQLELFGWPPPGHPYWCNETLAGVCKRYPGFDPGPWQKALDR